MGTSAKNELLFGAGINFNDVPLWQRRGVGLVWENYTRVGINPTTSEEVTVARRRVGVDLALPMKDEYAARIEQLVRDAHTGLG